MINDYYKNKLKLLFYLLLIGNVAGLIVTSGKLFAVIIFLILCIAIIIKPKICLLFMFVIIPLYNGKVDIGFLNLYIGNIFVLIGLLSILFHSAINQKIYHLTHIDYLVLLLLISNFISWFNSPSIEYSLRWTLYIGIMISSYFLLKLISISKKEMILYLKLLLFTSALNIIIGLIIIDPHNNRFVSLVFDNPNALGNYILLILSINIAFLYKEIKFRYIYIVTIVLFLLAIYLTQSRASWLGLLFIMLGIIISFGKRFIKIIPVFILILFFIFPLIEERLFPKSFDTGIVYRKMKNEISYNKFFDHPIIGNGAGFFEYYFKNSSVPAFQRHTSLENTYIHILSEEGLLGFCIFLSLMVYIITKFYHNFINNNKELLILTFYFVFLAYLGDGFGEQLFYFPKTNWLYGFLLAIFDKTITQTDF